MRAKDIVRSWKDEEFLESLSAEERAALPPNPAGIIELDDSALKALAGARSIGGWCPDFSSDYLDPWDLCSNGWTPCYRQPYPSGGGGGGGW